MTLNRTKRQFAAGVLVLLLSVPALAQDLGGFQLFGPAEVDQYGGGPPPNEGWFFSFDQLYWSISAPDTEWVGLPPPNERIAYFSDRVFIGTADLSDPAIQQSTLSTAPFSSPFTGGQRVEFGHVEEFKGWMFGTYRLDSQDHQFAAYNGDILFDDPNHIIYGQIGTASIPDPLDPDTQITVATMGNLPMTFTQVNVKNSAVTWGVELMGIRRSRPLHNGGFLELFYGARYLEFNEDFTVSATGGYESSPLDGAAGLSWWYNRAENHIFGPQVGLRYFHKMLRWMLNLESRFTPGLNTQNFRQDAALGVNLRDVVATEDYPSTWAGGSTNDRKHAYTFSPVVELRTELRFQVTRNVTLRAGWTGTYMDGIARANGATNYRLPELGLNVANSSQDLFIHGGTFGVDINR